MSVAPSARLLIRYAALALAALASLGATAFAQAPALSPSPAAGAAAARDSLPDETGADEQLCALIDAAAEESAIPVAFFTRLLWKESSFRSDAVSPKGAQGIAQFMPGTAVERGLADPFDMVTAIPASARFLADLEDRFGNLGLAAAAYNAGAERVTNWLAGNSTLPLETQNYVLGITGRTAEAWSAAEEEDAEQAPDEEEKDCLALVALLKAPGFEIVPDIETAHGPWGVQVGGNFSRARAISAYADLQQRFPALLGERPPMIITGRMAGRGSRALHQVRVPAQTREEAEQICADLKVNGASCVVLKT